VLASGSRTQFGLPSTNSNRMLGPSSVSLLTSMRRCSSAGKDNCASMRSTRARSGRVPPGRLASVTSVSSIVGHSERLMRNGPPKLRVRPVPRPTAATICGL